jgi:hypothetical protein
VEKSSTSGMKTMTMKTPMEGGNLLVCQTPSPLSRLEKVGSGFGSSAVFCLASGSLRLPRSLWGTVSGHRFGPLAPVVSVLGFHGQPLNFPDFPRPWSLLIWVPSTALTLRRASVDHHQSGGFQDQARMGLFVLLLGAFWASGACGSCAGVPRAATVFPWSVPDPGIHLFR